MDRYIQLPETSILMDIHTMMGEPLPHYDTIEQITEAISDETYPKLSELHYDECMLDGLPSILVTFQLGDEIYDFCTTNHLPSQTYREE